MAKPDLKFQCLVVMSAIATVGEVPSGHLYAGVMNHMDYDTYMRVIDTLKTVGWIRESHHLLTCTPKGKEIGDKVSKTIADHKAGA